MSSVVTVEKRKVNDYKGDERPTWCPGCGDFGVLNAVFKALSDHNFDPKDVIIVSGIGCSSRLPFFTDAYGFHTVHGRAMPVAAGIRAVQPDMPVLAMGGDGDAFAIGVGHLIHAIRRNLNTCYVVMDNAVYGLTKGQTSPTAERGLATKATPQGASDPAVNPLLLALATGCTFVARGFSSKPKELADLIARGIAHEGFAFIDTYSPCPTFNTVNTFKYYRDATEDLPADFDPTDFNAALQYAASEDPLYLGLYYQTEQPTFEDHIRNNKPAETNSAMTVVEGLFDQMS